MIRALCAVLVCVGSCVVSAAPLTPERRAARVIEEIASLDIGLRESPSPSDYQYVASLLSVAHDLDPSYADLARALAEAAWSSGDNALVIEATRSVVRHDPSDTVAQLRLVSSIVNREQTVDGRLSIIERFTGDNATSIDPSVRSRLLLDAALLERDRGDLVAFESLLKRAARLDPSHKEAHALLAQTMALRGVSPAVAMRLQLKVLYADPLDPHVYHTLASLCAAEGATDSAWRFLNNAVNLYSMGVGSVPAMLREQRLSLLWQYEGPESIINLLNPSLSDERKIRQAAIDTRLALDEPIDDLGDPLDIRFEAGIDRIRLLAALAIEDQETVDAVLADLRRGLRDQYETMLERLDDRGVNRARLLGDYLLEVVSLQTMRAIVGVDAEIIERDIDQVIKNAPQFESLFRPLEPFTLFVREQYEEARVTAEDKLASSASRDLLIALSSDKLGDSQRAIDEYTQITLDYPLEAAGAFARSRLRVLVEDPSALMTENGAEMAELERSIPEWIDLMISRPDNSAALNVALPERTVPAHVPARLEIELRNLTTIPLAIGPTHPIDSDLLVLPGFRYKQGNLVGFPSPKVVDLGRRLRLNPRETLRIEMDANSPRTRWLLRTQSFLTHSQQWRVLQGFGPRGIGAITQSPFALAAETMRVERPLLAETALTLEELSSRIRRADDASNAVTAAASFLFAPWSRPDVQSAQVDDLVEALWARYERSDPVTRAWMLCVLPTRAAAPGLASFDQRVVEQITGASLMGEDTHVAVLAAALATRVNNAGSPLLEIASTHSDERVRVLGATILDRLDTLDALYADVDRPFETLAPRTSIDGP